MDIFGQWKAAEADSIGSEHEAMNQKSRTTLFYKDVTADCAFRCIEHSMVPTFIPGDLVFIHRQGTFRNGQVCAVQIGDSLTLKRCYGLPDGIRLVPDNRRFLPVDLTGSDAEQVTIYGIAVARKSAETQVKKAVQRWYKSDAKNRKKQTQK